MTEQQGLQPESARLDEAIAAYFQSRERGQPLTREEFLRQYPDLTEELCDFLDTRSAFERQAGPAAIAQAGDGTFLPATVSPAAGPSSGAGPTSSVFGDYELLEQIARG